MKYLMLRLVFFVHWRRMRNRGIGKERVRCGRRVLLRGFRHGLDSERRIFSIITHPTCRLNPSFVFTARIGALLESFHVLKVLKPFFYPYSMTLNFIAVAMP